MQLKVESSQNDIKSRIMSDLWVLDRRSFRIRVRNAKIVARTLYNRSRYRQVMYYVEKGYTNEQIAVKMGVNPRTVRKYRYMK